MKLKSIGMLAAILVFCGTLCVGAQTQDEKKDSPYFNLFQLPNPCVYLPAPPDTASVLFVNDFQQFMWGKSVRNTPRGQQASWESLYGAKRIATVFSEAMGITISKEATPEIYRFIKRVGETCNQATSMAKRRYMRVRPFARMNEHVSSEFDDETDLRRNGSYPSGHTAFGWSSALAMAEVAPEYQDTILRRGYEYGQSRIIVGAHWQSDVDAGRLAAAVAYGKMHTHPLFMKQLEKAKKEFCRLTGKTMPSVQKGDIEKYYTKEEMPNLIKCLPAPPDTLDEHFTYDLMRYFWGKDQRVNNPERAKMARRDGICNPIDTLFSSFNEALGMTISKENTPAIWKLLTRSLVTTDQMRVAPKAFYHRTRPYVRFHEHILTYDKEEDEVELGKEGSYPSGHTSRGWATALLLSEVCPENANQILKRGWDYGESRVIVGAHWQTDVDASRMGASIGYGALQASPTFREDMKAARQEYLRKKNRK